MAKIQGQLEDAQLENRTSDPSAGKAGRAFWDTTATQMKVDDGTNIRNVLRNDLKAVIGTSGTAGNNIRFHRAANSVLQFALASDSTAEGSYGSFAQIAAKIESFSTAGRPSAGSAGRLIYDTDLSTILCDNGSSWETIVTIDNSQVVTNKDIDGATASNTSRITIPKASKSTLDGLTRKQATLVFASDESILYFDDGTSLVPVGSGSSGINYIDNSDAAAGVSLWNTYADAAGSTPVDGTGGSANITLTRTTSSPLRGSGSFLITKDAANRQGQGVSTDFTIDNADKNKKLSLSFDFEVASGTFVTGDSSDIRCFIYDVTNAVLITPYVTTLPGAPGKFQATWDATSSTSYRLILHVATTSASAYTFKFDNVVVGPQTIVYGPAMNDWQVYTPTFSAGFGTVSNINAWYRRVGDSLQVSVTVTTGTVAVSALTVTLPSGLSIDLTKVRSASAADDSTIVGFCTPSSGATSPISVLVNNNTATDVLGFGKIADGTGTTFANGGVCFANNSDVSFFATVPISGWSTNVVASNSSGFYISGLLANGTRVTTTPTKLGEYRSRSKDTSSSNTFSDQVPTTLPSSSNGMRLHGADYVSAQTAGLISLYDIFVGKGKFPRLEVYSSTGKTGLVYTDMRIISSVYIAGVFQYYDPTTGVLTVNAGTNDSGTISTRHIGNTDSSAGIPDGYFDIWVSENALAVQQEPFRSMIRLSGGAMGSLPTKTRTFTTTDDSVGSDITRTTDTVNGDTFTINVSGNYSITAKDGSGGIFGFSLNNSNTTTTIGALTQSTVLMSLEQTAGVYGNCHWTGYLPKGSVIRHHTDGTPAATSSADLKFVIARVS